MGHATSLRRKPSLNVNARILKTKDREERHWEQFMFIKSTSGKTLCEIAGKMSDMSVPTGAKPNRYYKAPHGTSNASDAHTILKVPKSTATFQVKMKTSYHVPSKTARPQQYMDTGQIGNRDRSPAARRNTYRVKVITQTPHVAAAKRPGRHKAIRMA